MTEYHRIELELKFISPKALLVTQNDREIWLPKSEIDYLRDDLTIGEMIEIEIPLWLIEKNEIDIDGS